MRQLLPALAIALTGCLSPNPSFDEDAPTDALQTSADDASGPSDPGAGTSTGAPPSDATTIAGTTDGLTGATTDESATTPSATTGAERPTDTTTGGGDASPCPDDPRLALCFEFEDTATGMTVVPDGSGNANDGIATGLELTDGPWGQALVASESLALKIEDSVSLDITGGVTIELQLSLAALPDEGRVGLLDNDGQFGLFVRDSGALDCRASGMQLSGGALPVELWTHVACAASEDAMRLYIDGELVAEGGGSTLKTESDAPIAVANSSPAWDEPALGVLDRVRVWSDALSHAELCELAGLDACSP